MSLDRPDLRLTHEWLLPEETLPVDGRILQAFPTRDAWIVVYQHQGRTLSVWNVATRANARQLIETVGRLVAWSRLLGATPVLPQYLQDCAAFGSPVEAAWLAGLTVDSPH